MAVMHWDKHLKGVKIMADRFDGPEMKEDVVNHPKHYQSKSGLEVIEVIKAFTEDMEGIVAVDEANAIKYILRWPKKNGIEDLEKAKWYINNLIQHLKDEETKKALDVLSDIRKGE